MIPVRWSAKETPDYYSLDRDASDGALIVRDEETEDDEDEERIKNDAFTEV